MDIRSFVAGVLFALIWSSAFTSARIIVEQAPPLTISVLRYLIAGTLAVVLAWMLGQRPRFSGAQWRVIGIFGVAQNAVYLGLFFIAMQWVEASFAVITAAMLPLFVALGSAVFLGERLGWLGTSGLAIGTAGAILVMSSRLGGGLDPTGAVLCVLGVMSLAFATMMLRTTIVGGQVLMVVGLQTLAGGAALIPFALLFETPQITWTPLLFAAFSYTLLLPGLTATVIWFWLVARIGPTRAASFHFLNPFMGLAIAALVLGEAVSLWDMLGVCIVLIGIFAIQTARQGQKV